jgi:hypothetical protein
MFFLTGGIMAQPQPPVLIAPINNATNVSLFPTFDWYDVTGATSYRIQVFQGANVVIDQAGLTTSGYTVVTALLNYSTAYYWRVNATGASGTSNWSAQWNFSTQPPGPPTPNLLAPANNSINVTLTPFMDWESVTGASQYRLQISTSPSFSPTVLDLGGLASSEYQIQTGTLATGTQYYWRVNATGSGGTSNWSAVWNFTTVPPPPPTPNLISPSNGATNVSTTATLDWSDVLLVESYDLQISLSPSFSSIILDQGGITTSQFTLSSGILSGITQYYWRVNAMNAGGSSSWSTIWSFTTAIAPPAAPLLVAPSNYSTGVSRTPLLDWNTVSGAQNYRVQVSTNPSFTTTVINQANLTSSQYQVSTMNNLQYNTTYYWRVNATNSAGTGPYSEIWNFSTSIAPPPAPTLIYPANNATGISLTPQFDWSDVTGITEYRIQVSTNNQFTSLVLNQIVPNSNYQTQPGTLTGSTQFYWRVASINSGGQGNFSNAFTFTTQQTMFLSLKVFLEGFYNGTTQVTDTIKVYLAQATSPFTFRDSSTVVLSNSGSSSLSFGKAPNGNYYVVVKHRNHIETWSSLPLSFSTGNTVSYDFTTSANKAYGSNMKQVGSFWVLYGGDCLNDGAVNAFDYNLFKTQFGKDSFNNCDLNGDNYVDGYDAPILYTNFGKSLSRPY